ncbi:Wall-associated receptor kinase-like 14 [Heracleum sosnowskyi]|uniref:Wall-associated receptor kinase-like 14 n=1 Tax=Heracleum sosnowskyi TaxID=360622 RepID=A0AAD8N5N6_9APIA|nr:Wall-associated receptor kinase-like 14 [Heracleum sosnowskyi]
MKINTIKLQASIFHSISIITVLTLLASTLPQTHASTKCQRSCGSTKHLPFPFGFSSSCEIQLSCINDTVFVGEFPVQKITSDKILVNIPAKCGRPMKTLKQFFNPNYAPTRDNGILLQNCTTPVRGCLIPSTLVQTNLEYLDCGSSIEKDKISCYSEQNNETAFIDYANVTRTRCQSLISAVSTQTFSNSSAVSLEVQVVQLGWWLQGTCSCSRSATCTNITSPVNKQPGYRCSCNDGFHGDGFSAGVGCRKDLGCNIRRFFAGHCGGNNRIVMLVGGITAGVLLMGCIGLVVRRRLTSKTEKRRIGRLYDTKGLSIPVFPYKEIEKATHNFSDTRRLGTGAYGTVYCGKLRGGDQWVAIKRIKRGADTESIENVMNEIRLLSCVNHPNLVRLLGCSIERNEQILVYEFMPNGTLCQHLHRERGSGLAWSVRLTIATETAQAIAHLHSSINPPIYHRDIKSSNILLDYNYKTKVADFGLSRIGMTESSHISTAPQGTPGYLDPQYHQNYHLSDKSDVYSFGVVLLEIITALKVIDFTRQKNEVNLASFAIDRIGKGLLNEIIDPFIMSTLDEATFSSMHKVAELAFRCISFHSETRPSMTEVATELEQIKLSQCVITEEINTALLGDQSPMRVATNISVLANKGLSASLNSVESEKNFSPVSVQDSWTTDRSSPSSNGLLSQTTQ